MLLNQEVIIRIDHLEFLFLSRLGGEGLLSE